MEKDILEEKKYFFESFAESCLRPYITSLKSSKKIRSPKIFNDPIWHSILLNPIEIVILDSPLLQRLRRIRQLGVAHWVYPGAGHTRFEHSIGTTHLVAKLIESINTSTLSYSPEFKEPCINIQNAKILRMAALCHDIGQGVMSHVSENAIDNFDEISSLKNAFTDSFGIEKPKITEIAAFYLIGSKAFQDLIIEAIELTGDKDLPKDSPESIKKIIIGLPFCQDIPLLHELVNGPFDADKLDYMNRDAFMSGVPVVVDIPRIIQKIRAVKIPPNELPTKVGEKVQGGLPYYTFIGIDLSGGRTLDELMLGRTLLFDKIYHHQKVRASETMIYGLIKNLIKLFNEDPLSFIYKYTDDELININSSILENNLNHSPSDEEKKYISIINDLAERLRERRLFVRCFAFAQAMPTDSYSQASEQKIGLTRILHEISNYDKQQDLKIKLALETETILKILDKSEFNNSLPSKILEPFLWISPPNSSPEAGDVAHAYLIIGERNILPFREDAAETQGWADAYILTRDLGYVFAPAEFSKYIFLAAEKILRSDYGIHLPQTMLAYSKQELSDSSKTRKELYEKGYYINTARDIWPIPEILTKADIDNRLKNIIDNLIGYQGPMQENDSLYQETIHPDRIKDWLRQFQEDDMVNSALILLEKIRLIGRSEIVNCLDRFFYQHNEFQGSFLCAFGSPKDSSSIVTYYGADLAAKYKLDPVFIDQILEKEKPVIFIDDFIGSGRQAVTILETWFGMPLSYDLGETRVPLTNKDIIECIKKRKVAFVFCAGWNDGINLLDNLIKKIGLNSIVYIGIPEDSIPTIHSISGYKNEKTQNSFIELCKNIGFDLVISSGSDKKIAEERCLGYGNKANLLLFPYNTPTQTLTCMWASGKYAGAEWIPLFPRRKKE